MPNSCKLEACKYCGYLTFAPIIVPASGHVCFLCKIIGAPYDKNKRKEEKGLVIDGIVK